MAGRKLTLLLVVASAAAVAQEDNREFFEKRIRSILAYGATDEFGFKVVENPVHLHDLHATILHLLGLDHEKLDVPLQRAGFPVDRCGGERRQGDHGLGFVAQAFLLVWFGFRAAKTTQAGMLVPQCGGIAVHKRTGEPK